MYLFFYFKLPKAAIMEFIEELLPYMPPKRRSTAIPQYIQVFMYFITL